MTRQRKQVKYDQSEKGKALKASNSLKQKLETRQNRKPCLTCMKPIPLARQMFCSNDCRTFNAKLFKLPKTAIPQKCAECHNTGYFRQRYCSPKCRLKAQRKTENYKLNQRAASRRRRARKRNVHNETVYLEIIAQRDKYKCHICRKRVDMNLDVQDMYSPTMDHLIPISLGGDHTYANIRLAHRICNSRKGNRAINEQLLLFG
jgi:5-methylcytosine-specific restriction endonuclease McrA